VHLFDPEALKELIINVSYLGVFAIIFAESGLFFGFFLPGDSLLFTAGFLASQGFFDIRFLIAGCFVAAVLGDSVGYATGRRVGPRLFSRPESRFFKPEHLHKAHAFYEEHGGKTIILARFMPFVRTFAPIVAGIGRMDYGRFLTFNLVGGALWAIGLPIAGYYFGRILPPEQVDRYLLPIIVLIIVVSVLPSVWHVWRERRAARPAGASAQADLDLPPPTAS
jgi:membrane-associated protein